MEDEVSYDRVEGAAHMPLPEGKRGDVREFLGSFPRYVELTLLRMYQKAVVEGGGKPETSNPLAKALVEDNGEPGSSFGEKLMAGAEMRAAGQLKHWERNGIRVPEWALDDVKKYLTFGFAGLNVAEGMVLVTCGQEVYKKLLDLERKGGAVDWVGGSYDEGGSDQSDGGSGRGESGGFSVPMDEEQRAANEGRITDAQRGNIERLKEELRKKYLEHNGTMEGFDDWYNNFSQ